jgi:hypothetical protein
VTGTTTANVQIDNLNVDMELDNPLGGTDCTIVNGLSFTITGTLNGGAWDNARHEVVLLNDEGLTFTDPRAPPL